MYDKSGFDYFLTTAPYTPLANIKRLALIKRIAQRLDHVAVAAADFHNHVTQVQSTAALTVTEPGQST